MCVETECTPRSHPRRITIAPCSSLGPATQSRSVRCVWVSVTAEPVHVMLLRSHRRLPRMLGLLPPLSPWSCRCTCRSLMHTAVLPVTCRAHLQKPHRRPAPALFIVMGIKPSRGHKIALCPRRDCLGGPTGCIPVSASVCIRSLSHRLATAAIANWAGGTASTG